MGVQQANPSEYLARYGAQLEDSQTLVSHARQAGVVEDIVSLFFSTKSKTILSFLSRHHLAVEDQVTNQLVTKIINQVAVLVAMI